MNWTLQKLYEVMDVKMSKAGAANSITTHLIDDPVHRLLEKGDGQESYVIDWMRSLPKLPGTEIRYYQTYNVYGGGPAYALIDLERFNPDDDPHVDVVREARDTVIGSLTGYQRGKHTIEVNEAVVHQKYQGRQLMLKLYCVLIDKGLTIMSGESQSEGGMQLWRQLSTQPNVFVYGWDKNKKEAFHVFDREDDLGWDGGIGTTHSTSADVKKMGAEQQKLADRHDRILIKFHKLQTLSKRRDLSAAERRDLQMANDQLVAISDELEGLNAHHGDQIYSRMNYVLMATKGKTAE